MAFLWYPLTAVATPRMAIASQLTIWKWTMVDVFFFLFCGEYKEQLGALFHLEAKDFLTGVSPKSRRQTAFGGMLSNIFFIRGMKRIFITGFEVTMRKHSPNGNVDVTVVINFLRKSQRQIRTATTDNVILVCSSIRVKTVKLVMYKTNETLIQMYSQRL